MNIGWTHSRHRHQHFPPPDRPLPPVGPRRLRHFAANPHSSMLAVKEGSPLINAAVTYAYVALWIALSGAVIFLNKWVLAYGGFPFPLTPTLLHMAFCSLLAAGLVRSGIVESDIRVTWDNYFRAIMPIGALYAGTLWLGNTAYLYLSVSFIQMLKAFAPAIVFLVGCALGVDRFNWKMLLICMLCFVGVAITSAGEIQFSWVGFLFQNGSTLTESVRMVLVQLLLQSKGLQLNPITTLYYVAPACVCALLPPFAWLEARKLASASDIRVSPLIFLLSALAAFALNVAVFLLVGRTSALTHRIAGVVKDCIMIGASMLFFHSVVTPLNAAGYLVTLLAIAWYNVTKWRQMQENTTNDQG